MLLSISFVAGLLAGARAATVLTGQYSCATAGNYELCNNQWGISDGTGSQNATLISTSGSDISWSTTWTWADNENDVKTYTNVENTAATGMVLSTITSAPTSWDWEYVTESSGIRADVSYDIWFGSTAGGAQASSTSEYEIMIWLSGLGGIQPVGSLNKSSVSLAGYTWNIWTGTNSNWEVISFVSANGNINSFSEDLNTFFKYLYTNYGVSDSLYLNGIEAGTEAFTGSAELLTSSYSVSVSS